MAPDALVRIVYLSEAATSVHPEHVVGDILAASRRNNGRVGVTGALIFNRSTFGQVLEGPERAVEAIFARIEDDPRHADIEVLDSRPSTRAPSATGRWAS